MAKIFGKYDIYGYITKYFESLHTMGDKYIVQDIDDYIANAVIQSKLIDKKETDIKSASKERKV